MEKTIKFKNIKIQVVDTIVDKYNVCTVLGQTTKTPSFSGKKDTEEKYLGGAGVVASHLKKLGSQVTFTTVIGKDQAGKYVLSFLKKNKIKNNCIIDLSRNTTQKERFWADNHKLIQVDEVDNHIILRKYNLRFLKL